MNKRITRSLFVLIASLLLLVGCTTNQQKIAYNSIYSVEKTTTAAYDGYLNLVIQGKVSTNEVPTLSKRFNQFQASTVVALDAVQFNTNALAPTSLVTESQDIINLINSIKGK